MTETPQKMPAGLPDRPVPPEGPTTEALICFNLYAASHAFIRLYTPHLERLGLTYPQLLVLLLLHQKDGQRVGELCAALAMETNTLSPLLKRLADTGLLTRVRSEKDARSVEVRLTTEGQIKAAAAAEVPACIAQEKGMTEDGYRWSLKTLQALRGWIEEAARESER